jgi:predicted GNAT superfamily acetyltransferase
VILAATRVRCLSGPDELLEATRLLGEVWGSPEHPPVSTPLLSALVIGGSYVGGAYDGDRLVGACVGLFHAPEQGTLHSHIAGVARDVAGRGIGRALKEHQRAWALERGLREIVWTFDPLIARNAHFNLVTLGARATEYLPDLFGPGTDRLLVRWPLAPAAPGGPTHARVAVPADVEALRRTDPAAARRWRAEVRERLTGLLADGGRIEGFADGAYLVGSTA